MTHYSVSTGAGDLVGFFETADMASQVAEALGGSWEEHDGPMPSNDELSVSVRSCRTTTAVVRKRASGMHRAI